MVVGFEHNGMASNILNPHTWGFIRFRLILSATAISTQNSTSSTSAKTEWYYWKLVVLWRMAHKMFPFMQYSCATWRDVLDVTSLLEFLTFHNEPRGSLSCHTSSLSICDLQELFCPMRSRKCYIDINFFWQWQCTLHTRKSQNFRCYLPHSVQCSLDIATDLRHQGWGRYRQWDHYFQLIFGWIMVEFNTLKH